MGNYDEWKAREPEGEAGPDPVDQVMAHAEDMCTAAGIAALSHIARQHPHLAEKAEQAKKFFR